MVQNVINVGTTANSGTGDTLRDAMIKSNSNFDELYLHTANSSNPHGVTALQINAVSTSALGANSGVATLDSGGKLTSGQKPLYNYSELVGKPVGITDTASSSVLAIGNTNVTVTGDLLPAADLVYNIGSESLRWHSLYIGANTIYIGDTTQLSGTSISIDGGPTPNSISQTPTMVASRFTARPFTYNPGGGAVTVRPQIEFQDSNGISYPISFNTVTAEFSLDAAGNYGHGSLVAKKVSLTNSGQVALALTGNITQSGSYLNNDSTGTFRYDGNTTIGYDSVNTLTVKASTTFQGPVTFQQAPVLGDGNDNITINAGGSNAFVVTSSNFNLTSGGNLSLTGNAVITGNLTVNGTVTSVNSTQVDFGDNILVLNSGISGATNPTLDAGLQVSRGTEAAVRWIWDETNDYWSSWGRAIGNVSSLAATTVTSTNATATLGTFTTANVGTLNVTTINGTVAQADKLTTARTIAVQGDVAGSSSFDGTANATITAALSTTGVSAGTYTKVTVDTKGRVSVGADLNSSDVTTALGFTPVSQSALNSNAVSTATPNSIVFRDATASFSANVVTAAGFVGPLTGLASSATVLQTSRNIALSGDVAGTASFNGSADASITTTLANSGVTAGTYGNATTIPSFTVDAKGRVTSVSSVSFSAGGVTSVAGKTGVVTLASADITDATASNTGSTLVLRDGSGNFAAGTITAALSGNASTATTLQTARNIILSGDVAGTASFNGSADAAVTATLANVNGSAGSFGSNTQVATFTVNAKGLVTASSNVSIAFPVTSVASKTGAVTLAVGDVSGAAPLASPTFTGTPSTSGTFQVGTNLLRSVTTAISAAGSTQGTATGLTTDVNVVSSSTAGTQFGVRLPAATTGMTITVINTSANSIAVYPATGGTIDALASNAAFTLGSGARLQFIATSSTQWYSLLAVYG